MAQAATAVRLLRQNTTAAAQGRKFLWWMGTCLAVAALVIIYIAVIAANWPFTQQRVIDSLQERSLRTVTIGHFSRTYFPPGCTAEDIRFLHRKRKEKQPLITLGKLVLVTSYLRVFTLQKKLSLVRVMDMHVTVPPHSLGSRVR